MRRCTASAFVATIDDITRCRTAHELEAYLGVIPSERSSGEKRQLGHITTSGNGRMRWLLVDAAWSILRSKSAETVASSISNRLYRHISRSVCPWNVKFSQKLADDSPSRRGSSSRGRMP